MRASCPLVLYKLSALQLINRMRVLRGGSWIEGSDLCRSAHRYRCSRGNRGDVFNDFGYIGFRVVCELK